MNVTGTINSVLTHKTNHQGICSILPEETVFQAISMMAQYNVGALLVLKDDKLVGVVSERDYTRKVALRGKSSKETLVSEILTSQVITVTPQQPVDECLRLMTQHHVRHLPVLDGERVVGVVSIGDLVNWIISTQSQMISQLTNYISGQY